MSSYQPQSHIGIRLGLSGQAQTIAGLNATATATQRLQAQIAKAGETQHLAAAKTWAHNQALFTLRRLMYATTLAVGAGTAAVIGFGLKFNSSMQQNMVAFKHFLGSTELAEDYLNRLFDLAATTPFEFEGLVSATKRLIAFGYSGEQAFRTMTDIGDAAAGLGVSQEGIDRMTLAFGQMRTNGRILGGELRQLSEVGINARKYLQAAFNLSPDQMANIGALHIPAEQGIEAILQGLEKEFGGFAKEQASTFQGMLSTIHDYSQKLFGTITKPLFETLSADYLPKIVNLTKELSTAFEQGGWTGMVKAMDEAFGAGGRLTQVWGRLASIGQSLWIIWTKQLWPAITNLLKVLSPLLALLWPLSYVLRFIATQSWFFSVVLKLLILRLFWTKVALVVLNATMKTSGVWIQAFRNWIQLTVFWLRSFVAWSYASTYAQGGMGRRIFLNNGILARFTRTIITAIRNQIVWLRVTWANTAGQSGLTRVLIVARAALMRYAMMMLVAARASALFLLTNPIGWAILIISTLAILYFKWGWFHDKVNMIFSWIRDHWKLLVGIMLGPFTLIGYVLYRFWDRIWDKIQEIWSKAKRLWEWISDKFGWIPGIPGGDTPTNPVAPTPQNTRTVQAPIPNKIARIQMNTFDSANMNAAHHGKPIQVHTSVQINKKEIATAVSDYKQYKDAQR